MSESLEQMLRLFIVQEVERIHARDPLAEAVRDLTAEVRSLAAGLARNAAVQTWKPGVAIGPVRTEELQEQYRPDVVRMLFVTSHTSMAVPDATFYLANSHLFRCVRAAFVEAFGPSVPNGDAFLDYFKDSGCWLVILPEELRRGRGRPPRRMLPDTQFLVDLISNVAPNLIVSTGKAVATPLTEALAALDASPTPEVVSVRTPRELWKPQTVKRLRNGLPTEHIEPADLTKDRNSPASKRAQ